MVDELVDELDNLAAEIDDVAAASGEQTAKIQEVAATAATLVDDEGQPGSPRATNGGDGPTEMRPGDFE
jgi:methyl-accepting chemotaxis protein